ncbi:MAG: histidine kinase [Bacteroidales bacterium]|nr:histidine kinase [Bacteroidales bacterium]
MALYKKLEHVHRADWLPALHRMHQYRARRALNLALVSGIVMTATMLAGAFTPVSHKFDPNFHLGIVFVTNCVSFLLFYTFDFWVIRSNTKERLAITIGLIGSFLIAILVSSASFFVERLIYGEGNTSKNYVFTIIIGITAALIAFLISLLLLHQSTRQQTVMENELLKTENLRIQYDTLKQQLSPHFLFNSLNTLDGLIGSDDEKAHLYLQKLSATFRYTMQSQQVCTLNEELEFTHTYLYMMRIRYGQGLVVNEQLPPDCLERKIVPISLQLLIENAVKHNTVTTRHPLTIAISLTSDAQSGHQYVRVENNLQPKSEPETSNGIGLSNLNKRCRLLLDNEIRISRTDNIFSVEIPLL